MLNETTSSDDSFKERLYQLWARQACTELCYKYCRALDRMDEALLYAIFHEDARYIHGEQSGSIKDFIAYALATLRSFGSTQHFLTNSLITVEGDRAWGESSYLSYHRGLGEKGAGLGKFQASDKVENVMVGGRYLDRFVCVEGVWLIMERRNIRDWENWHPADERQTPEMPASARGARDLSDPSYLFRSKTDETSLP